MSKLEDIKRFSVRKAKLLGFLPGYDESWMYNVELRFQRARPGTEEASISKLWLGISAEGEKRIETVPFQPEEPCVLVNGQVQIRSAGIADKRTNYRVQDLKIQADSDILKEIHDFVINGLIRNNYTMPASPVVNPNVRASISTGGCDDKENFSASVNSFGNTQRAKQSNSSGPAVATLHKPIQATNFYGKSQVQPAQHRPHSASAWRYLGDPKPSQTMSDLRRSPVGSREHPIPTVRISGGQVQSSSTNAFTAYGKRMQFSPSATGQRPSNPAFGTSAGYNGTQIIASKSLSSVYDYDGENDENAHKPSSTPTVSPIRSATPPPSSSATTVATRSRSSSPVGLLNLGNSCYMNAVLQALFAQPSFNYNLQRISEQEYIDLGVAMLREVEVEINGMNSPTVNSVTALKAREKKAAENSLILCVLKLLKSCAASENTIDRQKPRLQAIKSASKKFVDSLQHDAQEFLCCLLDDLKEEHKTSFTKTAELKNFQTIEEMERAELLANPVAANFDFTLRKSLSCRKCGKVASETVESFNNLSVHIPNAEASIAALTQQQNKVIELSKTNQPRISVITDAGDDDLPDFNQSDAVPALTENKDNSIDRAVPDNGVEDCEATPLAPPVELSLQDCIDHFFQKEEIEYRSEQCGHADGGVVSYCLASLPRVFVIHLKRFLYTMTSLVGTKCTLPVTIPVELDLSKYCAQLDDVTLPKLIDSPLAPKDALKTEFLSPTKQLSPGTPTVKRMGGSRKRIFSDSDDSKLHVGSENDENVPLRGPIPKRTRSAVENSEMSIKNESDGSSETSSDDGASDFGNYTRYRLSAIVSHTGSSSDYGHYTTDAYHSALGRWFRFDDMAVKGMTQANVLEDNKLNGYIFFYTAEPVWKQATRNKVPSSPCNSPSKEV